MRRARFVTIASLAIGGLGTVLFAGCSDDSHSSNADSAAAPITQGTSFRKPAPAAASDSGNAARPVPKEPAPAPKGSNGDGLDSLAYTGSTPEKRTGNVPAAEPVFRKPLPGEKPLDENKPVGAPDKDKPEYLRVSFNELASFDYDAFEADLPQVSKDGEPAPPPAVATNGGAATNGEAVASGPDWQIPARIKGLKGKKVAVQGFMVPIEIRKDDVKSFLLVRNQMVCCFGVMVSFNEWIFVQMAPGKQAKFVNDTLVTCYGTLDVGEDVQSGMVMSIYRLEGEDVIFKSGF